MENDALMLSSFNKLLVNEYEYACKYVCNYCLKPTFQSLHFTRSKSIINVYCSAISKKTFSYWYIPLAFLVKVPFKLDTYKKTKSDLFAIVF